MKRRYIVHQDAKTFIRSLSDSSVRLACIDPPYYGVVSDAWDNQWDSPKQFVKWLYDLLVELKPKLTADGSLLMFGALGRHGERPFLDVMRRIEKRNLYRHRNWITWAKRRAYGKKFNYLWLREELVWYSVAEEESSVVFNIPYTDILRGYDGFNAKYPAKSPYKRVGNVFTDIGELMRPERSCQKPSALLERLVKTHSNSGDLVVDFFSGTGTTGIAALSLGRRFLGCDTDKSAVKKANRRCREAAKSCKP